MTCRLRRQGKRITRFPCWPTALVLLDEVAVTSAVIGRDSDCSHAFDVAVVSDSETAIDGLRDGHDCQNFTQLFKCYMLHFTFFLFVSLIVGGRATRIPIR